MTLERGNAQHKLSPGIRAMSAHSRRSASLTAKTAAINLAIGEPDFAPPARVMTAMHNALDDGFTHYADFAGDAELRRALAARHAAQSGMPYTADDVQITSGATSAIAAALLATTSPGDRVVVPDPTYSLYADVIRFAGGVPVLAPTTATHHLDLGILRKLLPGARSFVYCSPVNPTGTVYSEAELNGVGELLAGSDTIVIEDSAYNTLVYAPNKYASALELGSLRHRTVWCGTFSKSFAMTGFRVGYVIAQGDIQDAVARVHRTFVGAVNSAAQRAALVALSEPSDYADEMLAAYAERRALILDLLSDVPQLETTAPEGGFFVFPRILTGHTSDEAVTHLLNHGVRVRPGGEFGPAGEHSLRISFCVSPNQIRAGVERLRAGMRTLGS